MKEGDFLKIDFTGTLKVTGDVFETTMADDAKKHNVYDSKRVYGPAFVIIGGKMAVPGVESALKDMKVGDEREFDVPSSQAYGPRDPKQIQIISIAKFYKNDPPVNPVPGAYMEIDGRQCRIQSVSGGRVRVDFNNPLAGRDLHYRLRVVSEITDSKEKIEALMSQYGFSLKVEIAGEKAIIHSGAKINEFIKTIIMGSVKKWVKEIKDVEISEPAETKPEAGAGNGAQCQQKTEN